MIGINRHIGRLMSATSPVITRGAATTTSAKKSSGKDIVLIEGVRTPFLTAYSDYADLRAVDLQRHAIL